MGSKASQAHGTGKHPTEWGVKSEERQENEEPEEEEEEEEEDRNPMELWVTASGTPLEEISRQPQVIDPQNAVAPIGARRCGSVCACLKICLDPFWVLLFMVIALLDRRHRR